MGPYIIHCKFSAPPCHTFSSLISMYCRCAIVAHIWAVLSKLRPFPVHHLHWSRNVILTNFSWLSALKLVDMTTFSTAHDQNSIKINGDISFRWICWSYHICYLVQGKMVWFIEAWCRIYAWATGVIVDWGNGFLIVALPYHYLDQCFLIDKKTFSKLCIK